MLWRNDARQVKQQLQRLYRREPRISLVASGEHGAGPSVHFSGIGGMGMVSGARLAIEAGWQVRGSDGPLYPPASAMVQALGVPVAEGYAAANLDWSPGRVVIGNALSRGNPEVEACLSRKLHYVSLPEFLKEAVLRQRRPLVVAGTHGKTTTTALLAWLLDHAGLSPGFFIGGQPKGFAHGARLGAAGGPFVIEGDEYDSAFFDKRAKFFHYLPEMAIVTSVEFDHGDIYPDLASIERAFQWMLRQMPAGGALFLCADDAGARGLREHAFCPVKTYGLSSRAEAPDISGEVLGAAEGFTRLRVVAEGRDAGVFEAPMAGEHNLRNLLAAIGVALEWGVPAAELKPAARSFPGVRRRMDVFLESGEAVFVDDFAHHPTAIRETIKAALQRWPEYRLAVLFEPRSNTTVTRRFQHALCDAFAGAHAVIAGPIHRPERLAADERLDLDQLVADLRERGTAAFAEDTAAAIAERTGQVMAGKTVVLLCSNGGFLGVHDVLRERFPATPRIS